jgi:mitochondrial fission protein ELM1
MPPNILAHFPIDIILKSAYSNMPDLNKLPDIIIGNGRVSVVANAFLKQFALKKNKKIFSIQLQDPRLSSTYFNMVLPPYHDLLRGNNVFPTIGALNKINSSMLKKESTNIYTDIFKKYPKPHIGVFIGGKSKIFNFDFATTEKICLQLLQFQQENQVSLFITPSRRTSEEQVEYMKKKFQDNQYIYFWNGEGVNPYNSILAFADAFIVTGDSTNMLSEATTTGKPTFLYTLPGNAGKFMKFYQSLYAGNYIKAFNTTLSLWTPPALQETQRIAKLIIEKYKDIIKG